MAFQAGDVVEFAFTTESPVAGRRGQRRTGIGEIADGGQKNYSCWPPGYTVKVISSPDYKKGEHLAVTGTNLKRLVR